MTNFVFIVTTGDEHREFFKACATLESAVKCAKDFILTYTHESFIDFEKLDANGGGGLIEGKAFLEEFDGNVEMFEFSFEIRRMEILS